MNRGCPRCSGGRRAFPQALGLAQSVQSSLPQLAAVGRIQARAGANHGAGSFQGTGGFGASAQTGQGPNPLGQHCCLEIMTRGKALFSDLQSFVCTGQRRIPVSQVILDLGAMH